MLMGLLAVLQGCVGGGSSRISYTDDSDSGSVASDIPKAWADAGYWADGPLESIMHPAEVPEATHWEVRVATSADGATWVPGDEVLAYGMSSLDLVVADQALVISGMIDFGQYQDVPAKEYGIAAIATLDLHAWGSAFWPIEDGNEEYAVDPSLQFGRDGALHATWYGHSTKGVDPATIEGEHDVQRGTWSDADTFVQDDADPEFAYDWLVDPVVCELQDTTWMFYTDRAARVLAARSDDGGEHFQHFPDFSWEGRSVPFCVSGDEEILLVAQTSGGLDPPLVGNFSADGSFVETGTAYAEPLWGNNCTSPVIGRWAEQWVLACAVLVLGR